MIISKLLYGLETLQFNQKTFSKIDSFQMKGLRKILDIPLTYVAKKVLDIPAVSDEEVLQRCNDTISRESKNPHPMKVLKLSEAI